MKNSEGKILIVDDESSIRRALHLALTGLNFTTGEAASGEEGLECLRREQYEAILLDINMPGMGGVETCREIRNMAPGIAILMLSVRDEEADKVEALEAGADDYITKPFHIRELTARLRASVRRVRLSPGQVREGTLRIGELALDLVRRQVLKGTEPVRLTPKEFDLLNYFMSNPGVPLTHARLLRAVWGPEYGGELEYLRTFVRQLRKKIEEDAANPQYLLTDPYVGYRFREQ